MERLKTQLCAAVERALNGQTTHPPEAGRMLWQAFLELSGTRTYSMAGPNPIQPSEVLAWCRLKGVPLEPRHVGIIFAMDRVWLDRGTAKAAAPSDVPILPPISKQPLTAALLDAVMG